jgi:hypothetical protein
VSIGKSMPQLTLFSIPKGFTDPHTSLIQRNALASWRHLGPEVEVLVMGDDPGVAEAAAEHGARHINGVATNEYGTPLLDWAFGEAARIGSGELICYLNADIVLLADFLEALQRLPREPYLAIGQRWNCDVDSPIDFSRESRSLRQWVHRDGKLDEGRGSDYFAFPRGVDFGLPPFAVGRPGWDNWMMGRTRELGWPLIDITPSVTAIHQNHDYGHVAQRTGRDWDGPEADRNRQLAGWMDKHVHSPANATHLLTPSGLRRAKSPRHLRARAEETVALRPAAAPLRWLIRTVRSLISYRKSRQDASAPRA